MEEFIDSCGKKRKGLKKICPVCNKEFCTRKDQPYNACSKECRGILKRNRIIVSCAWCGKDFERLKSKSQQSKSGFQFCSRKCKDCAQSIGGIQEIMPSHFGSGKKSESYRKAFKVFNNIEKLSCSRCGYDEFECGIDIHHRDKDHDNISKDNLMALCAPCHRALHKGLWQERKI